jgi:hypothetical protein
MFLRSQQQPAIRPKGQVHPRGVAFLGAGFTALAIGVYLIFSSGVVGLFLMLAGMTTIVVILGIEGSFTGTAGPQSRTSRSNEYRERRAKSWWDKERENQEREVES